ncbi:MAG: CRISPR-associated endonuclease Cas1, partial [Cyanobacteria bacterium J06642_2]
MRTLYVSESGCRVTVRQESLVVIRRETELGRVALPLVELVLIFGQAQVTTQAMRACLNRHVPIAFLSRMGWCYGRVLPVEVGYRRGARYQQELNESQRLAVALPLVELVLIFGQAQVTTQAMRAC